MRVIVPTYLASRKAKINTESDSYKNVHEDNTISDVDASIIDATDFELKDIEGIGPTTAKKLKEAGIISVLELAVNSADQLALDIGCSKDTAATYIMESQRLLRKSHVLEKEFVTANSLLEKRKSILRCSTGSKSLDELLIGGIETQAEDTNIGLTNLLYCN
jgi:DNA repair protein RadA